MAFKHGNPDRPSLRTVITWLLHQLGVAHHRCDCCVPASVTHFHSQKRDRDASTSGPTIRRTDPDVAER